MIQRFEEFTSNIALAYKYIIKIKAYEMSEYGLKAANVTCLFFLGKYEDGLTATELCELCREDKAGVSKSLAFLKEKGYILQNEDGKKYRSKYVITEPGKKIFEKIAIKIGNVVEKVGEGVTDEERNIFYNTLATMVANLRELCNETENKK